MCSKLFITLSSVALLGMSAVAFSEVMTDTWAWYSFDANNKLISRPAGQIPQSDCLEMMCEYGCVEKNNLIGYCCPGNGQCRVESGEDVDLCCEEDEFCEDGSCVKKACTFNGNTYDHNTPVGECGKCVNGDVVQDTTKTLPECKIGCNTTTLLWNNQPDGTRVDDCHVCMNGQKVNAADGTKVSNCQECRDGLKVNMPDDTIIGECGKCYNGIAIQDINKPDPDCQKCDTELGSSTQWQWVSDPIKNDQGIQDSCHKCSNGSVVLKDTNKTIVCNTQCCITGQVCLDNQRCGCPEETPVWDDTQQKCVECVTNTDCKGDGQVCQTNVCTCPTGTTEYTGLTNVKACCNNTTHKLFKIEGTTSQACCLIGTFWDATRQQCVECFTTSDCGEGQVCTSEGKCENLEGLKCTSNKECNDGSETGDYYCHVGTCGGYKAGCQKISAYGMGHKAPYTWSHAVMGRSAAESWCKAQGLGLARWYQPSTVPSYIRWGTYALHGQQFQNTYMATDPTYNGSNGSCSFWLADGTYLYTCGGWQYAADDRRSGGCNAALCYGN